MNNKTNLFTEQPTALYWANLTAWEFIVVNQGGTSSGKGYAIMQVLCTIACIRRGYVIGVATNTIPRLRDDAMRIMADIIARNPMIASHIESYNDTLRTYKFKNGSIIEFKAWANSTEARGGKRDITYIYEANRIDYMTFFEAVKRTRHKVYIDYNPTERFYIHDRVIDNSAEYPSVKLIRSWHEHNPYLTERQHSAIENIQDKELWKVYARGLTGEIGGQVFRWREKSEPKEYMDVIWGLDIGYTNDPTVITKIYITQDYDYIVKELSYSAGLPPYAISEIMKANDYKDGQFMYCEHDNEFIYTLRDFGILSVSADKKEKLNSILYVRGRNVYYTPDSKNLANEVKRYKFIEVDGKSTNKTIDAYDHACDSARYAIYTHRNFVYD